MKEMVELKRPIYIGQAVLDISKYLMYKLYYKDLLQHASDLNGSIDILGGDTDSFFLHLTNISTSTYLERLKSANLLDKSNYPPLHALYSNNHTAEIGIFKDETRGSAIQEWVHLRPKSYSFTTEDGHNEKRSKGVQRYVVENHLSHPQYFHS